ncbi:MAG TPA: lipoyl(octanoyl) transferase LipB [Rhodocyclaceae bacterium]|nr:lipoyl(octanoyl) transferase LipB [Rhodocyclaceae bacterium]
MIARRATGADFQRTWRDMQAFTAARGEETLDEVWLCQHPPVFTQGLAGKPEHLLRDIGIPVVKTDRGGQITYHGPGQLVAYLLLDLRRRNLTVKALVNRIEQSVIELLAGYGITGTRRVGAPGVYVDHAKIAALGLKIKNGCSYHGLALNVAMDLAPFSAINPCGYEGMEVTQLSALCSETNLDRVGDRLLGHLERHL